LPTPLVSVLLPFHNADMYLSEAIESVIKQTYNDWELILVNNASNDDSNSIAKRFCNSDSRIKLISEPQKGIAFALNTGLKNCTGNYIARMDADDIMPPDRLQLQAAFLESHQDYGLISGVVNFISEIPDSRGYSSYVDQINKIINDEDIKQKQFLESPFAHPSVMFRKDLIEIFGNYSTEAIPKDYELWLRWLSEDVKMAKLSAPVICWRDHSIRLSRTHENYHSKAFDDVRFK
jgi:glycosyltransferase involved in cell wall biosynthesis